MRLPCLFLSGGFSALVFQPHSFGLLLLQDALAQALLPGKFLPRELGLRCFLLRLRHKFGLA